VLTDALAALASAGGTALVTAMVTDGWDGVKGRVARLLGRGDEVRTAEVAGQLEQSRAVLTGLSDFDLERARAEQEIVWRTWLGDLLEREPGAEPKVRAQVAEARAPAGGSAGRVEQRAAAFDQAQQAVQGHGVQNVTFGGQVGPSAT
jgi:hypothetical protein